MRCRAHACAWALFKQGSDLVDERWVDQRFVPLHIDHQVVGSKLQQCAGFSQAITATWVIISSEQSPNAMGLAGLNNLDAIGRDHHLCSLRQRCPLRDANHHGQTMDVCQGFVGQSGGG